MNSGGDYMGENVCVHGESYDPDNLSFFELEDICKDYGYKAGDLMYFREPDKTLMGGLHLITCDDNVLFMVSCHKEQVIVHLYVVCFEEGQGDVEEYDEDDDDEEEARVDYNDPWWKDKVSDVEDLFDVKVDTVDTRTGASGAGTSGAETSGAGDGDEEDGNHAEEHDGLHSDYVRSETGPKNKKRFENEDDDDTNSKMVRSDILESPPNSDEEDGVTSKKTLEFHQVDMANPVLKLKMTFPNIQTFREAVKEYNVQRGKEIRFKKNDRRRSIVVCKDVKCKYRVCGRQVSNEQTFQIISIQPKHVCGW
jgi:hypothetical protein